MKHHGTTDFAVAQQLAALAHPRYEVGISLPAQPASEGKEAKDERMMIRRWSAAEVERSLGYLKSQNAKGSHIYIRPEGAHAYSFVDDLSRQKLGEMKAAGFPPALVVESSPNNFQAWIAHGQTLSPAESTAVAKSLASRFGGDPSSADWRHFGRLAGFTNRKPKYLNEGRYPFVKITESSGEIAPGSAQLIDQVRHALALQRDEEAKQRLAYQRSSPGSSGGKSIEDFRASAKYGGDDHRADLAFATYAVSKNVPLPEIEAALRSRDLSHKGGGARQRDYVERTIKKAQDAARGPSR